MSWLRKVDPSPANMIPESRRNQAAKDEVIGSLCRITTELANVVVEDMLEVEVVTALYAVVYQ